MIMHSEVFLVMTWIKLSYEKANCYGKTSREYRYKQTRTNHASFAYGKIDNTCIWTVEPKASIVATPSFVAKKERGTAEIHNNCSYFCFVTTVVIFNLQMYHGCWTVFKCWSIETLLFTCRTAGHNWLLLWWRRSLSDNEVVKNKGKIITNLAKILICYGD